MYFIVALLSVNVIAGIGPYSSKFPCPYGECKKTEDEKWLKGANRTFENLQNHYEEYCRAGSVKSERKNFFSVHYPPLVKAGRFHTLVIITLPPPPLHLIKLGKCYH